MTVFARRILGLDMTLCGSAWWAYPSPWVLARLAAKTDLSAAHLKHMTFADWTPQFRDDDARERFSGIRLQTHSAARRRETRLAVCLKCLDSFETAHLALPWMLGWLSICQTHQTVMLVRCSQCMRRLQLPSFNHPSIFNPATCTHCEKRLVGSPVAGHPNAIKLQSILLQGKRSGLTLLAGIGELTWPQTVTLLDLLVNLFWTGTTFEERWQFSAEFADEFPPTEGAEMSPYHSRYGGLCMLSWLLSDWDRGRGATVARLLLSRWLAGLQPQASRFAGIRKLAGDASAVCTLWDTPESKFLSILVAACGGDAPSSFFARSPFFIHE